MNPHDFLEVANEWITSVREVDWRSAVSRAYYGAFHVARLLLERCGFSVPRGDQAHGYLWLRLANSGRPAVENAGNKLSTLRGVRNWADYDLTRFLDHLTAFDQVQAAEAIVQTLEAVSTTPTVQQQITDAMKIYERDVLGQVTWHP